jgi:hypothetical protein
MKTKIIVLCSVVIFALIIISPPLVHGYVYPNIGHDTAAHLDVLDKIVIGKPIPLFNDNKEIRYFAYYILGYPMDAVSQVFSVSKNDIFFWFNYLALIGVGLSLFYIFTKLVNLYAGLMALILPTFASYAILLLFYSGVVFNIINVGIILPFMSYFLIQYIFVRKLRYVLGAIILGLLFAVFHSTGIYLPFFIVAWFAMYLIYKRIKKERISRRLLLIVGVIMAVGALLYLKLNPLALETMSGIDIDGVRGFGLLWQSLAYYFSIYIFGLIIASAYMLKEKTLLSKEKITLAMFGSMALVMLPAMLGLSPIPFVQGLDFAVFLSMVAVILTGIVYRIDKTRIMSLTLGVIIVASSIVNLNNWVFGYNSALEPADLQAIEYLNESRIDTFSTSNKIDYAIYGRFTDSKHLPDGGNVFVSRNIAMKSSGVLGEDIFPQGKILVAQYQSGDIEVTIYR